MSRINEAVRAYLQLSEVGKMEVMTLMNLFKPEYHTMRTDERDISVMKAVKDKGFTELLISLVLPKEKPITMDTAHGNKLFDEFLYIKQELEDMAALNIMIEYEIDYNPLMKVWAKFRELRFEEGGAEHHHRLLKHTIAIKMTHGTLPELYEALVKAVEWVNCLKQTT